MALRTIRAISKATHAISKTMMHGNTSTFDAGYECVIYSMTKGTDEQIVEDAKSKCDELGVELWKVYVEGSKSTSFSTRATWCESELYLDNTRALYFEGVFDGEGNKIDM